jgi:flagellar biogenesis protein FliO
MSYHRQNSSKSMHIVNSIILILMLLMIAIFTVDRFNQT